MPGPDEWLLSASADTETGLQLAKLFSHCSFLHYWTFGSRSAFIDLVLLEPAASAIFSLVLMSGAIVQDAPDASKPERQQPGQMQPRTSAQDPDRQRMPLASPQEVSTYDYRPLTLEEKVDQYLTSTYGFQALGRSVLVAGFRQWIDRPEEWDQGWEGFGRRLGSKLATHTMRRTIHFGFAVARGEELRFERSDEVGFWPRTWHVVKRTVTVRNDRGDVTIGAGKIVGALTAGFVSNTWHPEEPGAGRALARTGVNLSTDVGYRMLREFWPDIRARFRRR